MPNFRTAVAAWCFGIVALAGIARGQVPEPKTSMDWFVRASEQMNIRMPGSAPFHLRVGFHAYPGAEFLGPKETPQVITGDGVYDELWLTPHMWRREVTFGDYHAVEVESAKGRKMQTSSDYEPSRVLTLLSALIAPVPRNLFSREFRHDRSGWKLEQILAGRDALVRISRGRDNSYGASFADSFYLAPQGELLMRNDKGLIIQWERPARFGEKLVPQKITVRTQDSVLLSAEVKIEQAGPVDPSVFDLPSGLASPGETLRPLQRFEIRQAEDGSGLNLPQDLPDSAEVVLGVIDKHGHFREVELIAAANLTRKDDRRRFMQEVRPLHWHPAKVDGDPCQEQILVLHTVTHRQM